MRLFSRWSRRIVLFCLVSLLLPLAAPIAAQHPTGLDPANMDFSVDPADDFYRFANGGWLDSTGMPATTGAYGAMRQLQDTTTRTLISLMNGAMDDPTLAPGSDTWKATTLYAQGLDMDARNADGIDPIRPILDEIAAIGDMGDLHDYQQTAVFDMVTGLFAIVVSPNLLDSTTNTVYLDGPYLGLPNRDYYTQDDAATRDAYIEASAALLVEAGAGQADAAEAADAVSRFESELAALTMTLEEQQDPSLGYNPMSIAELQEAYPAMDWAGYLQALGMTGVDTIVVSDVGYLESLSGLLATTPVEVLKDYYTLEVMWTYAPFLTLDTDAIMFAFTGTALEGITERRSLEEVTLGQVNDILPDAVGQLYVDATFPPEAKDEITALVDAEIEAFRIRIQHNPWMSDETRVLAIEKLDAITVKVGYPDKWETYESVEIGDSFAWSVQNAYEASLREELASAGQPVDPGAWDIAVQTVNAYYNPLANEIVFPAAILQPPFFTYRGDPAANFGGIGMVIGHELIHGFDLSGSQFDAEGNLVNWWTDADRQRFLELNQDVADQYSAVEVLPGLHINGQLTVGENVADLGGVQIAHDAMTIYLAEQGQGEALATPVRTPWASPVAGLTFEDLTPEQRFFVSVATVWRMQTRDEYLRMQVLTDPHSPAIARALMPIQNMDEFYAAFDIQPGDAMYLPPEQRILIW